MKAIKKLKKNYKAVQDTVFVSLCTALICLSSYFVVPLPATPSVVSLQSLFISLTALCLKPAQALLSVCLYVFMGAIGLPVFSAGTSGFSKLLGPTGGYYFGFILAVYLIGLLKGKEINKKRYLAVTLFVSVPVEHLFAIIFMSLITGSDIASCFLSISLPFIAGDLIKAVAAALIGEKVNKSIGKMR